MIDALTAVSGSGPAYLFYMVEALAAAAEHQGFDPEKAMRCARYHRRRRAARGRRFTAIGSRENVTSPKGTTAAALSVLMAADGTRAADGAHGPRRAPPLEELGRG